LQAAVFSCNTFGIVLFPQPVLHLIHVLLFVGYLIKFVVSEFNASLFVLNDFLGGDA